VQKSNKTQTIGDMHHP